MTSLRRSKRKNAGKPPKDPLLEYMGDAPQRLVKSLTNALPLDEALDKFSHDAPTSDIQPFPVSRLTVTNYECTFIFKSRP